MNIELVDILVCPETKEKVSLASEDLMYSLNRAIKSRKVVNEKGELVTNILQYGLLRKDGKKLYPVRNLIPLMIVGERISIEQFFS